MLNGDLVCVCFIIEIVIMIFVPTARRAGVFLVQNSPAASLYVGVKGFGSAAISFGRPLRSQLSIAAEVGTSIIVATVWKQNVIVISSVLVVSCTRHGSID